MSREVIGGRISFLRKKQGLTQEILAQKIGVSRVSISYWESAVSLPRGDNLVSLAKALNSTPEYIMRGNNSALQKHFMKSKKYPILSPNEVPHWINFNYIDITARWLESDSYVEDRGFWLVSNSLVDSYFNVCLNPANKFILVDIMRKPQNDDLVIICKKNTNIILFRCMVSKSNEQYLVSCDGNESCLKLTNKAIIIGVAVELKILLSNNSL